MLQGKTGGAGGHNMRGQMIGNTRKNHKEALQA